MFLHCGKISAFDQSGDKIKLFPVKRTTKQSDFYWFKIIFRSFRMKYYKIVLLSSGKYRKQYKQAYLNNTVHMEPMLQQTVQTSPHCPQLSFQS